MALKRAVDAARPPALCRTMRVAPRVDPLRARVRRRAARARPAATGSDAATAAPPSSSGNAPMAAQAASASAAAAAPLALAGAAAADDTSKRPVPPAQRVDLAEPRARPAISTVLYYVTLGTYAAFFATTSLVGPDAADAVVLRLANDHSAVAEGDVLRLFTSSFAATESLYQLGLYLIAMLTLGAELEGILGPELFWATYALSAVAGGFADAALPAAVTAGADGLPRLVTQGPAPAVAGMVGALLVHTARNWRFESAIEALRKRISENRPLPPWLGLRPLVDAGQTGSLAAAVAAADAAGSGPMSSNGAIQAFAAVSKLKPTSTAVEKAAVAAVASAAVADNPLALLPVVVSSFSLSRKAAPVVSPAAAAAAAAAASSSMDEESQQQQQQQQQQFQQGPGELRAGVNGAASAAIAAAVASASAASPPGGGLGAGLGAGARSISGSLDGEDDDPLHDEPGGLTTAEVDLFMGYSASFLVPRDVQAIVRAAGTGGAALRALVDAFASGGGADSLTSSSGTGDGGVSVAGLAAGALAGCVLGYAFSPTYELARRPIDHARDDDEEAAKRKAKNAGAKTKPAEASGRRRKDGPLGGLFAFGSFVEGLGGGRGVEGEEGKENKAPRPLFGEGAPEPTSDDEVVVVDVRDAERGRAAVGFAALLYVAIAAWLIGPAAYLEGG